MKIIFTLFFSLFLTITLLAQQTVTGVIVDEDSKETLIGATVVLQGTTTGTVTGIDGSFNLSKVPAGKQILEVTYIGYIGTEVTVDVKNSTVDVGEITLETEAIGINEIRVLANIAIDRKTPIAVTNIKPVQIEEKLGTQEFPEILKTSPGVYATKRGGGFGDADVRIRGFGSRNIAVMINGMPVNGMENDAVYWSNWAGLSDVTRTMQVQRGIGASKIAVPSVGGTINVITKTTEARKGGSVYYNMGNSNYQKMGASLSTGLTENNWAVSMSFSKTTGNGYVEGTPFEGYSYFFSAAKKVNEKHQLALTVFGAPQEHARRYGYSTLADLDKRKDGHRYNPSWGYMNGQLYSNSTNFYHKPVAILNHYFNIDENTFLSSSLYASIGVGGGGYTTENDVTLKMDERGQIDWDLALEENAAYAAKGGGGGLFFQNSYNNHSWFGALSTLKKTVGNFDYLAGADLRYYYGEHWQQADDLFGADFIIDRRNRDAVNLYNNAAKEGDVVYYDNDGEVAWAGFFAQAEYTQDKLTAFASLSLSNRSYRRYDFAQYFTDEEKEKIAGDLGYAREVENRLQDYMSAHNYESILESEAYTVGQASEWRNFLGYGIKTGANYNLTDKHHVFANAGYMERQPIFSTVFQNYKNLINPTAVNEKVTSAEIGYGFRSHIFTANLNAYYTLWKDRTTTGNIIDITDPNPDARLFFNIEGVNARHMGLELDWVASPMDNLELNGMVSLGDWIWANNVDTVNIFKDQVLVDQFDALYLEGLHVADAAQTSASIGANYEILPGLKLGADLVYFDKLYADFDVESRTNPNNEGVDAERIPGYALLDMNMYYRFMIGDLKSSLYANMNNVLNTIYIADAVEGRGYYFGYGRTISMGLKIRF